MTGEGECMPTFRGRDERKVGMGGQISQLERDQILGLLGGKPLQGLRVHVPLPDAVRGHVLPIPLCPPQQVSPPSRGDANSDLAARCSPSLHCRAAPGSARGAKRHPQDSSSPDASTWPLRLYLPSGSVLLPGQAGNWTWLFSWCWVFTVCSTTHL